MFLLIVDLVSALPIGCRQQCLPPRLCCPRVGVAFSFSSVRCSPPSRVPSVGNNACLLASPFGCGRCFLLLRVLAVLRPRVFRLCRSEVASLPCLPFRVRALHFCPPRACCSPPLCPRPCFWGGVKPAPKTSLSVGTPLGCLFALSKPVG